MRAKRLVLTDRHGTDRGGHRERFCLWDEYPGGVEIGCKILAENYRRRMDVGIVTGGDYPDGRYFGNGVGSVLMQPPVFVAAKIRWTRGLLLYLIGPLRPSLCTIKPQRYAAIRRERNYPAVLMISIMNGRRMGGGFFFAPTGDPGDGWFDLCIARTASRLRIFGLILIS